jgi:hypothetical protein
MLPYGQLFDCLATITISFTLADYRACIYIRIGLMRFNFVSCRLLMPTMITLYRISQMPANGHCWHQLRQGALKRGLHRDIVLGLNGAYCARKIENVNTVNTDQLIKLKLELATLT